MFQTFEFLNFDFHKLLRKILYRIAHFKFVSTCRAHDDFEMSMWKPKNGAASTLHFSLPELDHHPGTGKAQQVRDPCR